MIRFRCTRCRKDMEAADEFAGLPVRCGACDFTQTLPFPGVKRMRLQCRVCGSEFTLRDTADCAACGEPGGLRRWCHVHRREVAGRACPRCVEEYGRRYRPPRPPQPGELQPSTEPVVSLGEPVATPVSVDRSGDQWQNQWAPPLAFGVTALALSLFCTCLASILGVVAVGWGATLYHRAETGAASAPPATDRGKLGAAILLGTLAILIDLARILWMLATTSPPQ